MALAPWLNQQESDYFGHEWSCLVSGVWRWRHFACKARVRLPFEEVEEDGQDNADDDACGDGKVESEMVFLDQNVARHSPQPGHFWGEDQQEA
jgi:hypothetical protein